jgi:tetratricopeptide (TPR) repeat protein
MTTQQDLRSADLAQLTALYEGGNYTQALQTIDALGLPSLLKEQPDAPGHASLALLIANVYRETARYDKADEYYLQALAGLKHTLGQGHPGYARGLVELGTLCQLQGRYLEASGFFEKARDIHEGAAAPDPVAHSRSLQALAGLHDDRGKRREAKACLTRARTLLEGAGASPVETAELLLKEAWVLCRLDNLHAVVSRARQALAIYREHKGERHPGTLQAGYQLGRLLVALCHPGEAAPCWRGWSWPDAKCSARTTPTTPLPSQRWRCCACSRVSRVRRRTWPGVHSL